MAEPKGKKNPKNQKRHAKKVVAPTMTPEQAAALKVALEKAEADRKAEVERLALWGASVEKMSVSQLKGEVRRAIRREHIKVGKGQFEPVAGLSLAFLTVFDAVLGSTKTLFDRNNKPVENTSPFAKLACYVR